MEKETAECLISLVASVKTGKRPKVIFLLINELFLKKTNSNITYI